MIPYATQDINARDIRAVTGALKSGWLTQGPAVPRFEEAFAKYCGARYAVAVSSGTAALHLSAIACGVRAGDEVLTTPMSFVASANAALYCGADARFADIDEATVGLDPAAAARAVTAKTRGVVRVHFAGQVALALNKKKLSKRADFFVIDDACHALGAEIRENGRWVKTGAFSGVDLSVFSFHPVKHITTGEGGMITTARRDLYETLLRLRSHGIERDRSRFTRRAEAANPWHYEMTELGYNYRITDIQCALGLSQLARAAELVEKRRAIAGFYDKAFAGISFVRTPMRLADRRSSWHLYVLRIDFASLGMSRAEFMQRLRARGVATQVHYISIPHQPYYKERYGFRGGEFPAAELFYSQALSIPMFASLKTADMKKVVREIKTLLSKGGK